MRRALHLTAGALLLLALGCGKSSTEPNRTLTYTGTIKTGTPVNGELVLNGVGNARATLIAMQQADATGAAVASTVGLSMGIGHPTGVAATPCSVTGAFVFVPGHAVSLGLSKGTYCLVFSEAGTLPTDNTLAYSMDIEVKD
jgi:hypothetical protein